MKKILLTLVLMVGIVLGLFAQKLTYQAVIRDNNQQLVVNTAVKATVTITFTSGAPYQAEFNGSTNLHGLLSIEFGDGSLVGRDWTGATIAVKVVNSATPSIVYVNDDPRPVSAVPYALSVNGVAIQNYLTEHNYVDKAELDSRHYLTSDSTVITTMQGSLLQLSNKLDVQIAKLDSIAHIVDSLAKLPHGGGEVPDGQACPGAPTVSDGTNTYNTVKIGNQCWMKENLRTTKYADRTTTIPMGSTYSNDVAYRYYPNGEESKVSTYGYLYNWKAVMGNSTSSEANPSRVQGICPNGWHVPSDAEWTQLITYVNGVADYKCNNVDNNIANALSSPTGWKNPSDCGAGFDKSTRNKTGFSAVPAGYYYNSYTNFDNGAYFWSATEYDSNFAYRCSLYYNEAEVDNDNNRKKGSGFSVRCLRD